MTIHKFIRNVPAWAGWLAFGTFVLLAVFVCLGGDAHRQTLQDSPAASGNPSSATADLSNRDNFLLVKPQYALSYNASKGTPNWVSWRLTAADIGTAPRKPFFPEPDLPAEFYRVKPSDYAGCGFDRGHMCNHSDRSSSDADSLATFSMANMIPQAPTLNRKTWDQLEIHCRELAKGGDTLWIVCGPHGKGGVGSKGPAETIAHGKVTVPATCWKVVRVEDGKDFGVIMPNREDVGHDWRAYVVPVAEVEKLTGYRFFDLESAK